MTARQLAKEDGIAQPLAARVLVGEPIARIDVSTLEALTEAFKVGLLVSAS
jgi:hypothetical protein